MMIKKEHYTHSYKIIITLFYTILSKDPLLHSLIGLNDLFYRMSVNKTHNRSNSKYDKIEKESFSTSCLRIVLVLYLLRLIAPDKFVKVFANYVQDRRVEKCSHKE